MESLNYFIPNLFIPGVAKCGTSTLHDLLAQHHQISMSKNKEPHFWTLLEFDEYTENEIHQYKKLFETENSKYQGESSTGSLFFPDLFIPRIQKANIKQKSIKFIIILRNPIDRAYSHYWWCKGSGREKNNFKKAILKDQTTNFEYYHDWPKYYFQFGLYSQWITPFIDAFGKENIKFITLENLKTNPSKVMNDCFSFLELPPLEAIKETKSNETTILKWKGVYHISRKISRGDYKFTKIAKFFLPEKTIDKIRHLLNEKLFNTLKTSKKYPKLSTEERLWLQELYTEEVNNLKQLTGFSFKEWTDFN